MSRRPRIGVKGGGEMKKQFVLASLAVLSLGILSDQPAFGLTTLPARM